MTLILERVHSISIYFSVFVHMIPKRHFATVQIVLEWVIPVFIPNEILVLVRNFILSHVNSTRTSFRIENRKSCSYIWSEWRMIWRENHEGERLYEPFDFTMWMQNKLHSGTKLIPEWESFRYHIYEHPLTEATGLMVCNILLAVAVNRIKLDL